MKRGNTALKRGVGLASAFALAIAGAVVAAPAANAAPADFSTDSVRAKPAADAAWVTGKFVAVPGYSATTPTDAGTVLKAKANNQPANGLQIALQSSNVPASPAWAANEEITVTLTGGATFSGTPSVSLDPTLRDLTSLDTVAGYVGNNAHLANAMNIADSGLGSNALAQPKLDATKTVLSFKLNAADPAKASVADKQGYLVSIDGVVVNTDGTTIDDAIDADVDSTNTIVAGSAPVGYVRGVDVSFAKDTAEASASGKLALPDITLTEAAASALTAGTHDLVVTSDPVGAKTVAATSADLKTSVKAGPASASAAIAADGDPVIVTTGVAGADAGSVTISGVTVTDVPRGATLKVSLTGSDLTEAATSFSFPSGLGEASATLNTAAAEPRIAGASRYATAADIADLGDWSGNDVIIANGETAKAGADALAANFLAAAKGAPILLTVADTLPAATQDALTKLFKGETDDINVYVMGKTDSVSQAVRDRIVSVIKTAADLAAGKDVKVVEVQGDNRYETSAASAATGGVSSLQLHSLSTSTPWARTAFLASGKVNADALAAGSASAEAGIPVLLADGDAVNAKVADTIKSLGITQVIILGGTDRISDKLVDSLKDLGVTNTKRIAESNRYATAASLYTWAFAPVNPTGTATDRGLGWATGSGTSVYLANGTDGFADALAVGPLAGQQVDPILTVQKDALSDQAAKFLKDNKSHFTGGVWALGQSDRISSAVITAAQDALK